MRYNTASQRRPDSTGASHGQQRTPEQLVRFAEGVRNVLSTTRSNLPGRHPTAEQMPVYSTHHATYDMLDMIGSYPMLRQACECIRYRGELAGKGGRTYYIEVQSAGINEYLRTTGDAIRKGEYQFSPLKRIQIAKPHGGMRTLDIPTIQDRVVECSMARVFYEWCSPTWSPSSMGFRPGTTLLDIMSKAEKMTISSGRAIWLTTDIADAFGSIPHSALLEIINKEIPHVGLQQMITKWLRQDSWKNAKNQPGRGIPQGSPLSPFMLNLYMDKVLDQGLDRKNIPFLRYADDLLMPCREEDEANQRLEQLKKWLQPWGLKLKEEKTLTKDIRMEATPYIGFRVSQTNERLKLDIDTAWHAQHLIEELERQASTNADPREYEVKQLDQTSQAKMVLQGWIQHFAPAISNGKLEAMIKQIKGALTELNVQGVQTTWIKSIWRESRLRWENKWNTAENETTDHTQSGIISLTGDIPFISSGTYDEHDQNQRDSGTRISSGSNDNSGDESRDETCSKPLEVTDGTTPFQRSDNTGTKSKAYEGTETTDPHDLHIYEVAGGMRWDHGNNAKPQAMETSEARIHEVNSGARFPAGSEDGVSSSGGQNQVIDNTASGLSSKNVQHAALWLFDGSEQLPAPVVVLDPSAPRRPGPMDQDWALTIV